MKQILEYVRTRRNEPWWFDLGFALLLLLAAVAILGIASYLFPNTFLNGSV